MHTSYLVRRMGVGDWNEHQTEVALVKCMRCLGEVNCWVQKVMAGLLAQASWKLCPK